VHQQDGVFAVDFLHVDPDGFPRACRHVLSHVVRPDRQLAVAPVDEDGELNRRRPAQVDELIERGADCPARIEDVVDQDHVLVIQIEDDIRPFELGLLEFTEEIIAVQRDVEGADGECDPLDLLDLPGDAPGDELAPRSDPHDHDAFGPFVLLEDLVCEPGDGAFEPGLIDDLCLEFSHGMSVRREVEQREQTGDKKTSIPGNGNGGFISGGKSTRARLAADNSTIDVRTTGVSLLGLAGPI